MWKFYAPAGIIVVAQQQYSRDMNYSLIPIDLIVRSPFSRLGNRPSITQSEIDHSVEYGIKTPVTVRKSRDARGLCYELIDGEREWMIAQAAAIHEIQGIVHDYLSDEEAESYQLSKLSRETNPENAIARAKQAAKLLAEEKHIKPWGALTRSAQKLGLDKSTLKHLLNLLKLDRRIQSLVENGLLDQSKARLLCPVSPTEQYSIALQIIEADIAYHDIPRLIQEKVKGDKPSPRSRSKTMALLDATFQGPGNNDPLITSLENELSEITGSPVRIEHSSDNRGYLTLQYFSLEELDSIMERIGKVPDNF